MGKALEYKTELLTIAMYDQYWPAISAELDRIPHVWAPWYTKDYLRHVLVENEAFVWATGPGREVRIFIFGRIVDFPAKRVMQLFLAFGNDLEGCLPSLMASVEKLANVTECDTCEIIGRMGWLKVAPGFTPNAVIMSKSLERFKVQ